MAAGMIHYPHSSASFPYNDFEVGYVDRFIRTITYGEAWWVIFVVCWVVFVVCPRTSVSHCYLPSLCDTLMTLNDGIKSIGWLSRTAPARMLIARRHARVPFTRMRARMPFMRRHAGMSVRRTWMPSVRRRVRMPLARRSAQTPFTSRRA